MDATVRVNAFSGSLLKGHVKSVATVASQADLFGSDVKVYQTFVSIDEPYHGRTRPGMDARGHDPVDTSPEPVLAIPCKRCMGTVEMGTEAQVFRHDADGHELREVTLGMTQRDMVEVKDRPAGRR